MADVFDELVFEKGCEGRGTFRIAGRADAALFATPGSAIVPHHMLRIEVLRRPLLQHHNLGSGATTLSTNPRQ